MTFLFFKTKCAGLSKKMRGGAAPLKSCSYIRSLSGKHKQKCVDHTSYK